MRPKVYSVAIELTAYCNQKCTYCYNEWREDGGQSVGAPDGPKLLARVEKLLSSFEIDHVTLTGGEPFAHKDIFKLLDRLREAKVGVQIISNGGMIDDELAQKLAPYKVRYVQCTLNAPESKLHGEHVGGDSHFAKTIEGVRAMKRAGVPVVGCIVVTRKNAHLVSEILALWESLGVRQIALSRFSPAGFATSAVAELLPSRDDLITAFGQALPYARDRKMGISCTMPVPPCAVETEEFAPLKFGTCPIGTSMQELAMGPDGKLKNCTLHRTAIGGVPDILDPSVDLAALLKAPEITEYRKRTPEFCHGCLHERTCGGGCGAAAEWVLGDARGKPDPVLWQHVDDEFAGKLEAARSNRKRLEVIHS
jgi:radical SAM protein with 4Fe4S-binding SPASM domain